MIPQKKSIITQLATLAVIVICVSIISSRFYFRIDMTEDRLYTLSEGSLRIVESLSHDVDVKLYFSKSMKELPVPFKTFGTRVEEILKALASHSAGRLRVEIIDPRPDSDEELRARKYGIQGVQLAGTDEAYLGAVFLSADQEMTIPYLDPRKEEFVEYEIAEALVKLHQDEKPTLAVMSSIPLENSGFNPSQRFNHQQREWSFINNLRNSFDIEFLPDEIKKIPSEVSVMLLFHPKGLGEDQEFAIDQFLLGGGRLIVAVDPFSRLDLAQQQQAMLQGGQMPNVSSQLSQLIASWGLSFHHEKMIGDFKRATRINTGSQTSVYPFFLSLTSQDLSRDNKITANLRQMLLAEAGWFEVKDLPAGVQAETLISTSESSGSIDIAMAAFMSPEDLSAQLQVDDKQRSLALMLRGHFPSAFEEAPENHPLAENFITSSARESVIALVADVDFLHDSNAVDRIPFINQVIEKPRNDNINFLVNAAEMLGGSEDLISIRTSGRVNRPFTRVRDIQQRAQKRWQAEEEKLSRELQGLQQKLHELQSQRTDGNRADLTLAQQEEIQRFRQEEAEIRTRRRQVRQRLREDIESLGHKLLAINLLAVPSMVSGLGIFVFWRRSRRAKRAK